MTYKMMALATALCALFAARADAAFDKSEAKCRKAISKSMG